MTQAIFLSYASQDADAARRICDALRAAGLEVWFDQSELRGGDAWDASIRKQIKECTLFVPIVSENTQQRPEGYFRLEWKLAVDRSHLMADTHAFFFPVVLGNVSEPAALVPDKFRERQWSRLNDDSALKAFVAQIAKLAIGSASPGKNAPGTAPILAVAPQAATTGDTTPSIAVLAFANRSASADDEYFSDGLADELLNVLTKIKGLRVAARTSAFSFKGKQTTVAEIGRILNVATVLEGSVRKSGNRVRISVQLVKVDDGFHLWSESYDRTLDDIFAVQDDIAQSVVQELRATLLGESTARPEKLAEEIAQANRSRSDNPEALRLCMQARFLVEKRTKVDLQLAISLCQQALAIDPDYAAAYATLATSWLRAAFYSGQKPGSHVMSCFNHARAAAESAHQLDPTDSSPHIVLHWIAWVGDYDAAASMQALATALAIAPKNAEVLRVIGTAYSDLGQFDEAKNFLDQGIALDRLSVSLLVNRAWLARLMGQEQEALKWYHAALEIDQANSWVHMHMYMAYSDLGDHANAVKSRALASELRGNVAEARYLREAFSASGWRGFLRAIVREPKFAFARYEIAFVHVLLGEIDQAFSVLDSVIDNHEQQMTSLKVDPVLAPLRSDLRFKALLLRAGFTE